MFWQNYKELCDQVGKSPNAVAAECGYKSSGTVTGWKNGAMPKPQALQKLAAYFNVTVSELLKEENPAAHKSDEVVMSSDEFVKRFLDLPDSEQDRILAALNAYKQKS